MQNEIETNAYRCLQLFRDLLRGVDINESHITDQLSPLAVEDQLGRYKLWTANLGALRRGHSSLDYRLRDASFIAENITRLLRSLQESLTRGVQLASRSLTDDASDSEEFGSIRTLSLADSSSSSSGEENISIPDRTAIQECYIDIVEIIDRLFKLSIAIRNPSIRTATSKALSYVERDELGNDVFLLFEQFTVKRIQARYPELTAHLAERLAKSISRRRRLFLYRRRHRKKLEVVEQESHNLPIFPEAGQIVDAKTTVQPHEDMPTQSENRVPTLVSGTFLSQTTATEYVPRPETPSEASSIISASMISGISKESEIHIPPVLPIDGNAFECPYCFCILHGKTQHKKLWEKHVFEDLQPYVCLFEHCPIEDQLFENYEEWLDHQKWKHNLYWCCDDASHPEVFLTQEGLEQHFIAAHSEAAGSIALSQLIKRSRRADSTLWVQCPFCGYAPERSQALAQDAFQEDKINSLKLEKHVGKHLKKIATFALPWRDDVGEAAENEVSNSRISASSLSSTSREQLQDWEDHPVDHSPEILGLSDSQRDLNTDSDEIDENWDFVPRERVQPDEDLLILAFRRSFEEQKSARKKIPLDQTPLYIYEPLDSADSEIRLISMLPTENGNELCADIFHFRLQDAPPYIYLSYKWGTLAPSTQLYIRNFDSVAQLPGSNLATALRQLEIQGTRLPIWADAICINQNDIIERNTQIRRIPNISAQALQTIIWLGPSSDDSEVAMANVKTWSEDGRKPLFHSFDSPSAVASLFSRPWWTRIWTFQDIFLPNEVLIQCGRVSLPLQDFTEFVKKCVPGSLPSIKNTPAFHVLSQWEELKVAIDGGTCSLLRLMAFTVNYVATDPRDKVIAVLTLAAKEDKQHIFPDYSKGVEKFYIAVMRHLIERHGLLPLYLLHKCIDEDASKMFYLPSWVVNWSSPPPTYTGLAFDGVGSRNTYRACGTAMSPAIHFQPDDSIRLEGCIIAKIVHFFPYLQLDGPRSTDLLYGQAHMLMSSRGVQQRYGKQNLQDALWRTIVADRVEDFSCSLPALDWDTWECWLEDPNTDKELSKEEGKSLTGTAFWGLVKDRAVHRASITTSDGRVGLVPMSAQPTDSLVLFKGGDVPFVLREYPNKWSIIGEAYVHGVMNGELVEAVVNWEQFEIM